LYEAGCIPYQSMHCIPPCSSFNMDEAGIDVTSGRPAVSAPAGSRRIFSVSAAGDGRMDYHVTASITTRADGKGSSAFLIHSGLLDFSLTATLSRMCVGENEICLRANESGSMKRDIVLDWCYFFVRTMNRGLTKNFHGINQKPAFLFVDGHSSRWNAKALLFLLQNNIFLFALPSHSSIFAQPNDGGINSKFKAKFSRQISRWRNLQFKLHQSSNFKISKGDFNTVFLEAWEELNVDLAAELNKRGENCVTRAFKRTGWYPFNKNNASWRQAISSVGSLHSRPISGLSNEEAKILDKRCPRIVPYRRRNLTQYLLDSFKENSELQNLKTKNANEGDHPLSRPLERM